MRKSRSASFQFVVLRKGCDEKTNFHLLSVEPITRLSRVVFNLKKYRHGIGSSSRCMMTFFFPLLVHHHGRWDEFSCEFDDVEKEIVKSDEIKSEAQSGENLI